MSHPFQRCPFEPRLVRALRAGAWPHAATQEMVEHVAGCRGCSEVARIGGVLHAVAVPASLPRHSAGAIWWRAQLRRRHQALESASRPLLWSQVAALLALLAALAGMVAWERGPALAWTHRFAAALAAISPSGLLLAYAAGGVVLAALAALFATRRQ